MKALVFFVTFCSIASAQTNFFARLECANATFTNATISTVTPAYATITYDGGVVQVHLAELPELLREQYHYNSNTAAQYLADKKRKSDTARASLAAQQAAYARNQAALAGQAVYIQIAGILDETSNGGLPLCSAAIMAGGGGGPIVPPRLLLKNMPQEVRDFWRDYSNLKNQIATYEAQPIVVTANVPLYNSDGTVDQYGSQLAAQSAAADALYEAKQAKQANLERMNKRLQDMDDSQFDHTTIIAYPTGETFGGYPIWQCNGLAPKTLDH